MEWALPHSHRRQARGGTANPPASAAIPKDILEDSDSEPAAVSLVTLDVLAPLYRKRQSPKRKAVGDSCSDCGGGCCAALRFARLRVDPEETRQGESRVTATSDSSSWKAVPFSDQRIRSGRQRHRRNMAQHQKKLWQELLLLGTSLACSAGVMMWAIDRLDPQRDTKIAAKKRKLELQRRLGISLDLNSYEEMLAGDVINPAELSVSLEDIGGLKSIVNALYNKVIAPLQRPQLFSGSPLLKPSKGVLLYGPPGTGKTMLAKAIAKESCARFINIRASSIQSKWLGDTQKLVTGLFTLAWKLQPCIIFIDEIDALLGKRTGTEHDAITSMKTEFMQLWDGFMTQSDAHVLVLAATNRPWDLDEAVLRRLPLAYEVGLPDAVQRESILKVMLQNELKARGKECMDEKLVLNQPERGLRPLQRIAQQTVGYSGSDLMELCKQAACRPVHEYMDTVFGVHSIDGSDEDEPSCGAAAGPRPIMYDDLEAAIPLSRPSSEHAERYMSVQSNRSAWTQPAPSTEGSSSSATGMSVDQMKLLQMMLPLLNAIQQKTAEANGDAGQPPDGNGST